MPCLRLAVALKDMTTESTAEELHDGAADGGTAGDDEPHAPAEPLADFLENDDVPKGVVADDAFGEEGLLGRERHGEEEALDSAAFVDS